MKRVDPALIRPSEWLWAAISPPNGRDGTHFIDYSSLSYRSKEAREKAARYWRGGWPDLKRRGWTVARVHVIPAVQEAR